MTTLLRHVGLLLALGVVAEVCFAFFDLISPIFTFTLLFYAQVQVAAECCVSSDQSEFCVVFNMLSPMEQAEVMGYLGDTCTGDADEALRLIEKRKPNFMRFGRSKKHRESLSLGKKGADPNFLRFGRNQPSFLRFGKAAAGDPNFLRFGRRAVDPNFLRFGRKPNFLRFGK
ncbi:unnamed protein product [Nippostrongylus brasiliensis]|uniref:FMRFamide-like neuropeptides 1 (inferred by orthology to a C. elegans protein) n=1 Tax=Nippostrongylus brasiliensis TaxID=27835 RepID=A0A0N4XCV7_NIPBR|nr:unnamed protein product [Nippostrongylus brasiliensis]